MEILVVTKDAAEKTKIFEKCIDIVKGAGVSYFKLKIGLRLLTVM